MGADVLPCEEFVTQTENSDILLAYIDNNLALIVKLINITYCNGRH